MVHLNEISSDEEIENDEIEMQEEDDTNDNEEELIDDDENAESAISRVYLPTQEINSDAPLECDESAYVCYHTVKTGSPCLSFDIIPDGLGDNRAEQYPLTMTLVGGTQDERAHCNNLLVMKLSNMKETKLSKEEEEEEEESDSESEDDEDSKPIFDCAMIRHRGSVNRVKVTKINETIIASSWSDLNEVFIWDLSDPIRAVNDTRVMSSYVQRESPKPVFSFTGHLAEGYAMEWSPLVAGLLATGDCKKNIHLWKPMEGGSWHVDKKALSAHSDSVEDIQWSPSESNVMASCSVDKSIRVWDIRAASNKACMLTQENAHDSDVNVISWNKKEPFILSGGDDGKLRVWDLRKFPASDPICTFKHHTAPITSVEWHPTDHSVFAASGSDDQITQWDLATERDEDQGEDADLDPEVLALPPQLLFIHQGQKEIKEIRWHKQMPGVLVSTALTGFNVIRTLSV